MPWNDAILRSAESTLPIGWDDLEPRVREAILQTIEAAAQAAA